MHIFVDMPNECAYNLPLQNPPLERCKIKVIFSEVKSVRNIFDYKVLHPEQKEFEEGFHKRIHPEKIIPFSKAIENQSRIVRKS